MHSTCWAWHHICFERFHSWWSSRNLEAGSSCVTWRTGIAQLQSSRFELYFSLRAAHSLPLSAHFLDVVFLNAVNLDLPAVYAYPFCTDTAHWHTYRAYSCYNYVAGEMTGEMTASMKDIMHQVRTFPSYLCIRVLLSVDIHLRTSSPLSTRILVLVLVHNNILFTQINPSVLFPFFNQPLNEYMVMSKDINDALQTLNGAIY